MSRSVGESLGTSQTQDFVLLAGLGVAFYVIYQLVQGVKTTAHVVGAAADLVAEAYTTTRDALTTDLYILFGPDDEKALGALDYLLVNFPDGQRHAVPGTTITPTGLFVWAGFPPGSQPSITLQLVKDKSGAWYATYDDPNFGATPGGW
jgi:hypothetical protein